MQPTRRERERDGRETEGLTVPPVHFFSTGQTYFCCSQLLPSASPLCSSGLTLCCFHHCFFLLLLSSLSLDFVCCLATTAFYLFLGFHPTVILFLFIPTSSHLHNSLLPPHQLLMKGYGRWIEDTCRRNGWQRRGRQKKKIEWERWWDLFCKLFHWGGTIRIAETHLRERETCRGIRVWGGGGGHHIAETADQSRDLHTSQIFI